MTFPATFQVGARYWAQSVADHTCLWWFTVTARTAKFITLTDEYGKTFRVGVKNDSDRGEWALPFGSYSMAPVVRASRNDDDLPPSLRPAPIKTLVDEITEAFRGAPFGFNDPNGSHDL
jgi:hypothetical protein